MIQQTTVHTGPGSVLAGRPIAHRGAVLTAAYMLAVVGLFFSPSESFAQASSHEVTWAHGAPNGVARFVVYLSRVQGDLDSARQVDVGKPSGAAMTGTMTSYSAVILADSDEYVAIGAIGNDGVASTPSEWALLPPSKPGQPLLLP